jgi:hypothetical protein
LRNLAASSSLSASENVGSNVASTSPAFTCSPILTAIERTTAVSTGWITISLSLVTIFPLALTTMSTFSTASAIAAVAIRATISQRTSRRWGGTRRTVWKS